MSLLPDRYTVEQDIAYFCNDVVNRGVVLVFGSTGSGAALDDTLAIAALPGTGVSTLKPLGLLLNDMVSIDLTKFHLNFYRDQMPVGGKCTLGTKGWWVTDQIASGVTPVAGDKAYLAPFGQLSNTQPGGNAGAQCGVFKSAKDQNGYAKVEISLP